ncbi:cytochrome c biogenesis protein CcdA [Paracoccus gahaiensis]|uniref:Cytochrome c biogenesis protein CcdA n=1 Tax=Paracoccus gahaiensis TaxID=1706839 RepID=A0A4U0R658_9RHOB|nr:cytochrome c biogenesis CcdA family protein [Paracoccus gahaiensis]TJZ89860.1 cytochrome c biogenesis protein CcdA [Paracoccus gahaiensis]
MDLILAYLAGLLTLINPCVLPVLPIVLTASLGADPRGPLALAAGLSASFVALGLGVAALGPAIGLYPEDVAQVAALAMVGFGLVMLTPAMGRRFATATAGLAQAADARMPQGRGQDRGQDRGLRQEFAGGALLGAVWSPCIGPTLGAAIALASTGQDLLRAGATMAAFALGVSTLILAGAYGLRGWLRRNARRMAGLAARARPALGLAFVAVGLALATGLHHRAEALLIAWLPAWLIDLSVTF